MQLLVRILRNTFGLLVALGIMLSGFGMASSGSHAAHMAPAEVTELGQDVDSGHAAHAGTLHENPAEITDPHEEQAGCAVSVCCNVGSAISLCPRLALGLTSMSFEALEEHQHSEAERDPADKPPKLS